MAVRIAVTREYGDEKRHVHSNRLLLALLQKQLTALSDIFFNFWRLRTWLVKHEFSEQHMRIVNHQRSLISPIAVYGWNYKLFLVRSGSYWSRSARCEEICLNLCILGIFNWEIWNANSNGSGLTALCHLTRTFAVRSSLTFSGKIKWHYLKLKY